MRPAACSAWQLVQGYSPPPTYRWNTTGAPAGPVYFGVWVRAAGSTEVNDAIASVPYTLFSPCASASEWFSPASPLARGSGTIVTITGTAAGCSNQQFEFWMRASASGAWQLV